MKKAAMRIKEIIGTAKFDFVSEKQEGYYNSLKKNFLDKLESELDDSEDFDEFFTIWLNYDDENEVSKEKGIEIIEKSFVNLKYAFALMKTWAKGGGFQLHKEIGLRR